MGGKRAWAAILIVLGVALNNVVYLQDLWLGQAAITLDGWKAYLGILVGLALVVLGLIVGARATSQAETGKGAGDG